MNPNPIKGRKGGNRNALCPYYRHCLDHAVKQNWISWDCYACRHKATRELSEVEPFTAGDSAPNYSLSPDIYLKNANFDSFAF